MAGVAGGLLAAATGGVNINQFPVQNSIILLAVVLMGGVYSLWGAVVAALLLRFLPALLDDWGLSDRVLTILFGVGVLQVLLTAPGGPRRPGAEGSRRGWDARSAGCSPATARAPSPPP